MKMSTITKDLPKTQFVQIRCETQTDLYCVDYLWWSSRCYMHLNNEAEFWGFPSMTPDSYPLPSWITVA